MLKRGVGGGGSWVFSKRFYGPDYLTDDEFLSSQQRIHYVGWNMVFLATREGQCVLPDQAELVIGNTLTSLAEDFFQCEQKKFNMNWNKC